MTLIVSGKPIQSAEDLSETGRLTLHLVDGGPHWLHWAIAEPNQLYEFADESDLIAAIQPGLHGSPLAYLPVLQVLISPLKLMTLGPSDLHVLVRAEKGEGGGTIGAHIAAILETHGIRTQEQLQTNVGLLDGLGLSQPQPLFQVTSLTDQLALQELLWRPEGGDLTEPEIQNEAAAWAIVQARTPLEFIDYFQIYLALAAKFASRPSSPQRRQEHAEHALQQLMPPLLSALDCPQVDGLVPPDEVAEAVALWTGLGRRLGFARISAGVREIVRHTRYRNERGTEAAEFVALYQLAAQRLLTNAPPRWGIMAQDGATCRYPVHAGDDEAEVLLSPSGVISLGWFRRNAKPKPAGPRPAPSPPQMEPTHGR
jgi:hypothetical protein